MTVAQVSDFALDLPEAVEDHPFGPNVDVMKIGGRVFAILTPDDEPPRVSLKCDPKEALRLRGEYPAITGGYHLNKRHWNTIVLDGTVPSKEIREMVRHSYELVIGKLPKDERDRLRKI